MGDRSLILLKVQAGKTYRKFSAQKKEALFKKSYSVKEDLGIGNYGFSEAKHSEKIFG